MQQLGYNFPTDGATGADLGDDIRDQLRRMLASPEFQNSDRMSQFLRYVVLKSATGQDADVKEVAIGVAVFGRDPGYNPKTDPVVRSEARRLREKIQRYYERDGADAPILISLPKGGYAVQFEHRPAASAATEVEHLDPEPHQSRGQSRHAGGPWRFMLAAVLACAFSVAGGALLGFRWAGRARAAGDIAAETWTYPLTGLPGQELDPTISPTGERVVFAWNRGGDDFDLYAVDADRSEPVQLTSTGERDLHPAYSPDGRQIAFLRTSADGIEVWSMEADGSRQRKLTEIRWFEWFNWRSDLLLSAAYPGPVWTPEGHRLIISDVAGSQQGAALWEFDTTSGTRRQLSRPHGLSHDFFPAVSPDSRRVAFVRQFSASNCDIYLLDRASGREHRLTHDAQDIRGLTWMPDSHSLLFSSARGGMYQLWKIDTETRQILPVPVAAERVLAPAVSRDGRLLVYTNARININLWLRSLDGSSPAQPLIQSVGQNLFPRFSPDGTKLVWASDRSGGWEIWTADRNGTQQRRLTYLSRRTGGRLLGTPRWSPDGQWIAFDARLKGNCAIYVVNASGGEPRLLHRNSFEERNPAFSRDGKWIYFNSNRGGRVQIWRSPVNGGEAVRVSGRAGYDAIESPVDGSVLFLPALAEPGIWSVNPDGEDEHVLLPTIPFFVRRHWDVAGKHTYFLGHDREPRTLMRYRPGAPGPERVARLDRNLVADVNSLTISPDERWIVFSQPDTFESDLFVTARKRAVDQ
ncbi:MAG TPA: hypothetical protein VES20_05275 [Bryobacteraceae bacterium]|nr:hypothetical protein [Bryobacteraceae bacterium]